MPNETLIDIDDPPVSHRMFDPARLVFSRGHIADALVDQAGIEYWEARKLQQDYYKANPPFILNIDKKTLWEKFCEGVRSILWG